MRTFFAKKSQWILRFKIDRRDYSNFSIQSKQYRTKQKDQILATGNE